MANKKLASIEFKGDDLKGLKFAQKVLNEYRKHKVKVGVLGGNYSDGISYAQVGMLHEFGTVSTRSFQYKGKTITIKGIPQRSWLRLPLNLHKDEIIGFGKVNSDMVKLKLMEEMQTGYKGEILGMMGINAQGIIRDAFGSRGYGQWLPNKSQEYIRLKGSDTPLWDTGALQQAVNYEVV